MTTRSTSVFPITIACTHTNFTRQWIKCVRTFYIQVLHISGVLHTHSYLLTPSKMYVINTSQQQIENVNHRNSLAQRTRRSAMTIFYVINLFLCMCRRTNWSAIAHIYEQQIKYASPAICSTHSCVSCLAIISKIKSNIIIFTKYFNVCTDVIHFMHFVVLYTLTKLRFKISRNY